MQQCSEDIGLDVGRWIALTCTQDGHPVNSLRICYIMYASFVDALHANVSLFGGSRHSLDYSFFAYPWGPCYQPVFYFYAGCGLMPVENYTDSLKTELPRIDYRVVDFIRPHMLRLRVMNYSDARSSVTYTGGAWDVMRKQLKCSVNGRCWDRPAIPTSLIRQDVIEYPIERQ